MLSKVETMDFGGVDLPLVNGSFPYTLRGVHLRKQPTYRLMRANTRHYERILQVYCKMQDQRRQKEDII